MMGKVSVPEVFVDREVDGKGYFSEALLRLVPQVSALVELEGRDLPTNKIYLQSLNKGFAAKRRFNG
jgi:hypothetical protein